MKRRVRNNNNEGGLLDLATQRSGWRRVGHYVMQVVQACRSACICSGGGVLYGMCALLTSPLSVGSKAQLWQHGSVPTSCSLSPVFHCCGWDNGEECLSDEPAVHASRGGRPRCCIAWMFQESRLGIGGGRGILLAFSACAAAAWALHSTSWVSLRARASLCSVQNTTNVPPSCSRLPDRVMGHHDSGR